MSVVCVRDVLDMIMNLERCSHVFLHTLSILSGLMTDCPEGQFCYTGVSSCTPTYKNGAGSRYCGSSYTDMTSKCATECKNGQDDECPPGEICWGDSPCGMIDFEPFDIEAAKGKLWCGRSYKNLVEECPAECPGATDEECGEGMTCFNMATENVTCTEVGVGIKEPVDSANLWCGATWNEVLENCAKSCPEGSDEECGDGMMCYDLTGNDLICEYEGVGVKEKGDPDTRFCGVDYNDMLANCPKRCPGGTNDECGEGMICFEGSPCTTEGATNPVTTEEETTTEGGYCGSTFKDAMSCATPCSSSADCPGQTCHSNVACLWEDVSVNFTQTTTSSSVWNNFEEVTMQEPTAEAQAAESNPEPIPAPAPAPEEPAASEPAGKCAHRYEHYATYIVLFTSFYLPSPQNQPLNLQHLSQRQVNQFQKQRLLTVLLILLRILHRHRQILHQ